MGGWGWLAVRVLRESEAGVGAVSAEGEISDRAETVQELLVLLFAIRVESGAFLGGSVGVIG